MFNALINSVAELTIEPEFDNGAIADIVQAMLLLRSNVNPIAVAKSGAHIVTEQRHRARNNQVSGSGIVAEDGGASIGIKLREGDIAPVGR